MFVTEKDVKTNIPYTKVHLEFDIMKERMNKMNEMRNEMRREREEGVYSMNENKELNNTQIIQIRR